MYNYYPMTFDGRPVHVIYAKADSNHEVQISLMADRYDSSNPIKLASDFHDYALESEGFSRVGVLNGGIFNNPYANGLEKAYWNDHEMFDDYNLDSVMAVGHSGDTSNSPTIDTQYQIRVDRNSYRGAVTAAFGLLRNGVVTKGDWSKQGIPYKKSGRAIIGRTGDGTIYFIASPGVSPTTSNPDGTGLNGDQCIALAQSLGLTDAVAMDGGGSVSLIYEGSWKVSTSRKVKNAWGLYVKQKSTGGGGDPDNPGETPVFIEAKDNGYMPVFKKQIPHKIMHNGQLCPIKEILVMKNGILVPIDELRKGSS